MQPVTVAHAVNQPPHNHLRCRVPAAYSAHVSRAAFPCEIVQSLNCQIQRKIRNILEALSIHHNVHHIDGVFKSELLKLHRNHYSLEQMVLYLSQNNFQTDEKTLNTFIHKALAK